MDEQYERVFNAVQKFIQSPAGTQQINETVKKLVESGELPSPSI